MIILLCSVFLLIVGLQRVIHAVQFTQRKRQLEQRGQGCPARIVETRFKPLNRFRTYGEVTVSYEYDGRHLLHTQKLAEKDALALLQGVIPVRVCVLPELPSTAMLVNAQSLPFDGHEGGVGVFTTIFLLLFGLLCGGMGVSMLLFN